VTTHRISKQDIAYAAMATLEEWFRDYMSIGDGRQYKVVQVEHGENQMVVEVRGTQYLDVEEEQFEVEIKVRRVE
jgi:4-aminobutyrate aminotransferase-like enzyme